jgi:hypothetical protein
MPQKATELQQKLQLSVIWITHAVSCYIGRKQTVGLCKKTVGFCKVSAGSARFSKVRVEAWNPGT